MYSTGAQPPIPRLYLLSEEIYSPSDEDQDAVCMYVCMYEEPEAADPTPRPCHKTASLSLYIYIYAVFGKPAL